MLDLFKFKDNQVRAIILDGEPWVVAVDVAKILDYNHCPHMLDLVDNEDKRTENPQKFDCLKIRQTFNSNTFRVSLINESGVYDCIFHSTKPEAKIFKRWVTSELLPTIRKTGSYNLPSKEENIQLKDILDQVVASNKFMIETSQETLNQIISANKRQTEELMLKIDSLLDENAELRFIQNQINQVLNEHPLSALFVYVKTKLKQNEIIFPKRSITVRQFLEIFNLDVSQVRQIGVLASLLYFSDKKINPSKSSKGYIYFGDEIIYLIAAAACKLNLKFDKFLENYPKLKDGN